MGWWSTALKKAASLQGAVRLLPLYVEAEPVKLTEMVEWTQGVKYLGVKCREESPRAIKTATAEDNDLVIAKSASLADKALLVMVSSVRTYRSHIASGRLEFLRYGDSFRAVDTQAGSIGIQQVAPVVSNDQLQTILSYVHSGAAEELKTRRGDVSPVLRRWSHGGRPPSKTERTGMGGVTSHHF